MSDKSFVDQRGTEKVIKSKHYADQFLEDSRIPISPILRDGDLVLAPGETLEIERKSFKELGMRKTESGAFAFERYKILDRKKTMVRHYIRFLYEKQSATPPKLPIVESHILQTQEKRPRISDEERGLSKKKKTKVGNPGKYLGPIAIHYTESGIPKTQNFHLVEAIEGTWLSAATKKFGWGRVYGPEDGYGAYVEGIVRREDGSIAAPWDLYPEADKVKPGERFVIEIRKRKTKKKPKFKPEHSLPKEFEPDVGTGGDKIAWEFGKMLALEIAKNTFPLIEFFSILNDLAQGILTVIESPWKGIVKTHAISHAVTSFAWYEKKRTAPPLPRIYTREDTGPRLHYKTDWDSYLKEKLEETWRLSWTVTTHKLQEEFEKNRVKYYMKLAREDKNVAEAGAVYLRKQTRYNLEKKFKNPSKYCKEIMKIMGKYNYVEEYYPPVMKGWWENIVDNSIYPDS